MRMALEIEIGRMGGVESGAASAGEDGVRERRAGFPVPGLWPPVR
jgi:hypothetical protein